MQSLTQKNSEINYFWYTKNELQVSTIVLHWLLLQQKKKYQNVGIKSGREITT
jgi:hypothetical protein